MSTNEYNIYLLIKSMHTYMYCRETQLSRQRAAVSAGGVGLSG